ncbi:unnamed protein product [Vitrella brassicaformis CCMP3155]|uniref:Uncharacterized protein n=1 Tax=Vitrella brassicaformis (strain CCMP3155) TaxID=1169540 RepID=A0A0G4F243_VITBC|nr:unnamed protein product [Vitrella brassicaformis CCMP3155]|eukprot:CEM05599.1 unnamed protein product [Vitrella brassicaformis CCMP3155]
MINRRSLVDDAQSAQRLVKSVNAIRRWQLSHMRDVSVAAATGQDSSDGRVREWQVTQTVQKLLGVLVPEI